MNKVYEYVKENILKQLEEGKEKGFVPWQKSWIGFSRPRNYMTEKEYNGINTLLLPKEGEYLTFNQIKQLQKQKKYKNIKLKKGSKGNMIVFWKYTEEKKEEDNDNIMVTAQELFGNIIDNQKKYSEDRKSNAIFRYYNVFHISDIENLDSKAEKFENESKKNMDIEVFLKNIQKDINFTCIKGSNTACFKPNSNIVEVPSINQFKDTEEYYLSLFHELIHATGHKNRLNRLKSCDMSTDEYSKEELVAEIGANILGTYFGIEIRPYSISYINGWQNRIKSEKGNFIVNAAQQADKAVDYLLSINKKED